MEAKDYLQVDQRQGHWGVCSWPTSSHLQGGLEECFFKYTHQQAQRSSIDDNQRFVATKDIYACQKPLQMQAHPPLYHAQRNCFACFLGVPLCTGPVEDPGTRTQRLCATDSHHPSWGAEHTILWCICTKGH